MSVSDNIAVLNEMQSSVYNGHRLDENEKEVWRQNVCAIKDAGYSLKKKRELVGGIRVRVRWYASMPRKRHFVAELDKVMVRPHDGLPCCKGDCTTRAMAYCLGGAGVYREIEKKQYEFAEKKNAERGLCRGDGYGKYHRNTDGVWDKVMMEMGYVWIRLGGGSVRRDKLAEMLSFASNPIITKSSGHVAVIDKGKVIDSWDSRHGRCTAIMVDKSDYDKIHGIFFH